MGAVGAPGVTGTVWAKAVVLRPSPRKAAKANAVAFIRKVRINKGKEKGIAGQPWLARPFSVYASLPTWYMNFY
jgi:hypothetical protein